MKKKEKLQKLQVLSTNMPLKKQQQPSQQAKNVNQCNSNSKIKNTSDGDGVTYNNKRLVGWKQHQQNKQQQQQQNEQQNQNQQNVLLSSSSSSIDTTAPVSPTEACVAPYYNNTLENRSGKCFFTLLFNLFGGKLRIFRFSYLLGLKGSRHLLNDENYKFLR